MLKLMAVVNFINILCLHFLPIFWRQKLQSWNVTRESLKKHFHTKNAHIQCWWNQPQFKAIKKSRLDNVKKVNKSALWCVPLTCWEQNLKKLHLGISSWQLPKQPKFKTSIIFKLLIFIKKCFHFQYKIKFFNVIS